MKDNPKVIPFRRPPSSSPGASKTGAQKPVDRSALIVITFGAVAVIFAGGVLLGRSRARDASR